MGQEVGKIKKEEETVLDERGRRDLFSKEYHENETVKRANAVAKQRNWEGLNIKDDKYSFKPGKSYSEETDRPPSPEKDVKSKTNGGGYEVNEYQTSDYSCNNYETTEYKSVYE